MITFIQARVPRTSLSKHYQQKAHFCDLSLCTDVPPPSEIMRPTPLQKNTLYIDLARAKSEAPMSKFII